MANVTNQDRERARELFIGFMAKELSPLRAEPLVAQALADKGERVLEAAAELLDHVAVTFKNSDNSDLNRDAVEWDAAAAKVRSLKTPPSGDKGKCEACGATMSPLVYVENEGRCSRCCATRPSVTGGEAAADNARLKGALEWIVDHDGLRGVYLGDAARVALDPVIPPRRGRGRCKH